MKHRSTTSPKTQRRAGRAAPVFVLSIALLLAGLAGQRLATEARLYDFGREQPETSENRHYPANPLALPGYDSRLAWRLGDHLLRATPASAPALRLETARALQGSLAKAPARARDWATLAGLGTSGAIPLPLATGAFRMAVITEVFSPDLTTWLFEQGIRLWPVMNAAEQAAFRQLVHRHWAWQDGLTAQIAVKYRAGVLVEQQFADNPVLAEAFARSYAANLNRLTTGR